MSKRGMSAVVTTLIIILLAIVAIGVVWVVIKNIVSKGEEDISLTGLLIDLEIQKASVDDDTLYVTVHRNAGEGDLVGINFIIGDGDNSVVVRRNTDMAPLATETFTFTISTELATLGEISGIAIAPIYRTSSGNEKTGEAADTVDFVGEGIIGDGGDGGGGESPEVCGNGICDPTETCLSCEEDCGVCPACGDGICDLDENCSTCESDCGPCSGEYCGDGICNGLENCGTCEPDCECPQGQKCDVDTCVDVTYIETGTIDNVWPQGAGIYFDSSELTRQHGLYYGYAVAFPQVQTNCYLIIGYVYDGAVYENAIVELYLGEPLEISSGDTYEIWESVSDCENSF